MAHDGWTHSNLIKVVLAVDEARRDKTNLLIVGIDRNMSQPPFNRLGPA